MAIKITCPHCQGPLEVYDELIGKVMPCPHCKEELELAPDDENDPHTHEIKVKKRRRSNVTDRYARQKSPLVAFVPILLTVIGIGGLGWYVYHKGLVSDPESAKDDKLAQFGEVITKLHQYKQVQKASPGQRVPALEKELKDKYRRLLNDLSGGNSIQKHIVFEKACEQYAHEVLCYYNLKNIYTTMMAFAKAKKGVFPGSLNEMALYKGSMPPPKAPPPKHVFDENIVIRFHNVYHCPGARDHFSSDYIYLGKGARADNKRVNKVLMVERLQNHKRNWVHVLFTDGHIERVPIAKGKRPFAGNLAELNDRIKRK